MTDIAVTNLHPTKFAPVGKDRQAKSHRECVHDRDRTYGSTCISGISVLLTVPLTIKCNIKLEISLFVALVTVTARFTLGGKWAVIKSHEI